MPKISLVLVHNRNAVRLGPARRLVKAVSDGFEKHNWAVESREVFEQPEVVAISRFRAFSVKFLENLYQVLYLLPRDFLSRRQVVPHFAAFLASPLAASKSRESRERMHVDEIITSKHAEAWGLARVKDFVMVIEDDAVLEGPLSPFLDRLVEVCVKFDSEYLFVDLAGGYDLGLKLSDDETQDTVFLKLPRLATNTACVYLMNSRLADLACRNYASANLRSSLGVDFFLNALFDLVSKKQSGCYHAAPGSPIIHGSMAGSYESWAKRP
jgi:hypothetical protein